MTWCPPWDKPAQQDTRIPLPAPCPQPRSVHDRPPSAVPSKDDPEDARGVWIIDREDDTDDRVVIW